jgi:sugar O-acyltransferase (sialic acid O-acetyltransferase NeuD family)
MDMCESYYAIYGVGGCGRGILPLARTMLEKENIPPNRLVFIDDNFVKDELNGHSVLTYQEFLMLDAPEKHVAIAIADSVVREKLVDRLFNDNLKLFAVRADNIVIMDDVKIGNGSLLSPYVSLTSNIRIGRCFHANLYSYVEHDCVIGDFVTFAPGVKCNGNVVIEDHAYIGAGAIIKQGKPGQPLTIGRGAIVGMGAVVTKSVPACATVVGNPAKIL